MTIETDAAPGAAAGSVAPENNLANTTEVATPEANTEAKPEVSDHERTLKKLGRRIDNVTRARYEAEARAQQAEERAKRAEAMLQERPQQTEPQTQEGKEPPRQKQADPDDIERRATELATIREVAKRSNDIVTKGSKAYGDEFRSSVVAVQDEAGPMFQRSGLPTALGEAILDADDPAALLHHLGQNPEDAGDLRGLSAAQLGRRIARIEAQIAKEPEASKPALHKPVTPQATARSKAPEQMSDAEWAAQRKAQKR